MDKMKEGVKGMRTRIILDTQSQLMKFVHLCEKCEGQVYLCDGSNEFRVNAKSMLGCILARTEWEHIWCEYNGEDKEKFYGELLMNGLVKE